MKANKYIFIIACLLSISMMFCPLAVKSNVFAQSCSGKAMVVIDACSKRVLYGKNYDQNLPMASTTKIVTALTVLQNCGDLTKIVKIHDKSVGVPGTSIYLKHGEELSVEDLLYGMMLPSGNDAATALAYYIGGTIENFCDMMKQSAMTAGAFNCSFKNPHGLDEDGHCISAYELAKITAKALEYDVFKQIVTSKTHKIKGYGTQQYRYLKNKNKLLSTLDGCIGVKTGYTGGAGRCLASACERDGMRVVCVVLNCGPMFEESYSLINQCFEQYHNYIVLPSYNYMRKLAVRDGKQPTVGIFTKNKIEYVMTVDEYANLNIEYDVPLYLTAPIKKEQVIGELKIYLKNDLLFCEKIYTMEEVKSIGVWNNIKDIVSNW